MIRFLSKYKYWIFLSFLFLFLRLPSLFEPYWYGDEGIYLTLGQGVRKGLTLYKQIHDNKPPTLYYLAAISQTVFGFRLLLTLIMIPTILFFYKLCLKFFKSPIAKISTFIFVILTSIPLVEGNIANAEIFMLLPTIIGILIFLNSKKLFHFYLSGLFLGFAFTIKIPVFIEVFFLILYLLFTNFSKIKKNFFQYLTPSFWLGIGFLTPTFFYFIYFYFIHAVIPFLSSALLQNFSYISSWATGTQTASASSGGIVQRFIILIILLIVLCFLYFKKIIKIQTLFVLGWFFTCIFGSLLSTRPYPHYLIQILPPLCLLIGFLFYSKFNYSRIIILGSFFFLALTIKKYNFYFYPNLSYYQNFYSHIQNLSTSVEYKNYFSSNTDNIHKISQFISENSNYDDHIFIWGDEPYIYALSNRLPSGRYTVAYHIVDFNGYQETIDSLKSNTPKFIVYFSMENRPFPQLDDILNRYYFLDKNFSSVLIFRKR